MIALFFAGYNFAGAQTINDEAKEQMQICDCPQQSKAGKGTFYFFGRI
ncbi:MAG: hypothetical protein IPJ79_12275 [Bacteroidetes bacterium]|nr:hypothetical protein [Bacteroidota bacterium]